MKIPKQISDRTKLFTGALLYLAGYLIVVFIYEKVEVETTQAELIIYEVSK